MPQTVHHHMQSELSKLYSAKLASALKAIISESKRLKLEEVAYPLLLCTHDYYQQSKVKVMVFGQETNGWYGPWQSTDVNTLVKYYHDFYCTDRCYRYSGQFWNAIKSLKEAIGETMGTSPGLLWNNIVKVGRNDRGGRPSQAIVEAQLSAFNVVPDEVKITQPDAVLFFTGPNYDDLIRRVFPDVRFEGFRKWEPRKLVRIESADLPERSYRTYHPNYLWRIGFYEYRDAIVRAINGNG